MGDEAVSHICPSDSAPRPETDPDLALLAASWPRLPAAVRAGIVAMVRATAGANEANAAEAAEGRSAGVESGLRPPTDAHSAGYCTEP